MRAPALVANPSAEQAGAVQADALVAEPRAEPSAELVFARLALCSLVAAGRQAGAVAAGRQAGTFSARVVAEPSAELDLGAVQAGAEAADPWGALAPVWEPRLAGDLAICTS